MENVLGVLILIALVGMAFGIIFAIVKKIRKKSAKKSLGIAGVSAVIFVIAFVLFPVTPDKSSDVDAQQEIAAVNTEDAPSNRGSGETKAVTADAEKAVSNDKNRKKESIADEPLQEVEPGDDGEYIDNSLWLEYVTDFSEGRAWVQYSDSGKRNGSVDSVKGAAEAMLGSATDKWQYGEENWGSRAAVIDPQGKIIWESNRTTSDPALVEKHDFIDGISYCIFQETDPLNGTDNEWYYVIDSEGNLTYSAERNDSFIILGHGGGTLLAAKHISNFDTDEWQIGVIDKYGNEVIPFQVYYKNAPSGPKAIAYPSGEEPDPNEDYWGYLEYHEQLEKYEEYVNYDYTTEMLSFDDRYNPLDAGYVSSEYLGSGVYRLSFLDYYVLLSTEDQKVIYTSDAASDEKSIQQFLTNFEDDEAKVIYQDGYKDAYYGYPKLSICSLKTDGTIIPVAENEWIQVLAGKEVKLKEGLIYLPTDPYNSEQDEYPEGAYYTLEGKKVIDFPQYRGKIDYQCSPFCSGYASMSIMGADGLTYITAIDMDGNHVFEPISGYEEAFISTDGKYITAVADGLLTVFSIQGKEIVTVNCKEITTMQDEFELHEYNVHNDVIKIDDFYVNIKDKTVIGLHNDSDSTFSVDFN